MTGSRPDGAVLWYVHHHGAGHWRRALAVAAELAGPGGPPVPVVFASSAPPVGALPPGCSYAGLPADHPAPVGSGPAVDAGGRLHWAPLQHRGLLDRHRALLDLVAEHRPGLAVVDVSVEVTTLLRVSGLAVVAVRLPGDRDDPAHRLAHDLATRVVLPVPARLGLHHGLKNTDPVGFVSHLGPLPPPGPDPAGDGAAAPGDGPDRGSGPVVVVVGRGGSRLDPQVCATIAAALPDRDVFVVGLSAPDTGRLRFLGALTDPAAVLAGAAVVIGNAGLGTVADAARAGRPLIVVPEDRPFAEQHRTAAALASVGAAVVVDGVEDPRRWAAAVVEAESPPAVPVRPGAAGGRLGRTDAHGAGRFAALLRDELGRLGDTATRRVRPLDGSGEAA